LQKQLDRKSVEYGDGLSDSKQRRDETPQIDEKEHAEKVPRVPSFPRSGVSV
jgi:hypothetical protein